MSETSKTRHRVLPWLTGVGADLGCGDDKVRPEAIGVDRRALPGVQLVQDIGMDGFGDCLPLECESLDYVYSSHALEDLEDPGAALTLWWECIKPGGVLVLYMPDARWYPAAGSALANKAHRRDWRADDVLQLAVSAGLQFVLEHQSEHGPPGGVYDYERRGEQEYSFLLVLRKVA